MFIQPEQIRAARAMLDWSQQDLADAAGVSKDTVKNYELANNKPNTQTLTRIIGALEMAGIEFLSDGGLRPNRERIKQLSGADGMKALMDMVYQACVDAPNGHIIVANVQQSLYTKWLGDYATIHRERMSKLDNIEPLKFLINEEDTLSVSPFNYVEYRLVDAELFGDIGLYCFKSSLALVNFAGNNCNITVIDNGLLKDTMDKILTVVWNNAKPFEAQVVA